MKCGFTLIEVIIAMVVIALAVTPIMVFMARGTQFRRDISLKEQALWVAQQEMEKTLAMQTVAIEDSIYELKSGEAHFFVKREVTLTEGLYLCTIEVYRDTTQAALISLKSLKSQHYQ